MAIERPEARLSSLQQDRSRETRRRLVAAAQEMWAEHGFDDTTVSDICDAAGVAKGTFYFYFPHKEDLLLEISHSTSAAVFAEVEAVLAGDAPTDEVLERVIAAVSARVERTPKELLVRVLHEIYRRAGEWNELRGDKPDFPFLFTRVFERAQARGDLPRDYHPAELAHVLSTTAIQGMVAWAGGMVGTMPLAEVLRRRATLVLNGARAGL